MVRGRVGLGSHILWAPGNGGHCASTHPPGRPFAPASRSRPLRPDGRLPHPPLTTVPCSLSQPPERLSSVHVRADDLAHDSQAIELPLLRCTTFSSLFWMKGSAPGVGQSLGTPLLEHTRPIGFKRGRSSLFLWIPRLRWSDSACPERETRCDSSDVSLPRRRPSPTQCCSVLAGLGEKRAGDVECSTKATCLPRISRAGPESGLQCT